MFELHVLQIQIKRERKKEKHMILRKKKGKGDMGYASCYYFSRDFLCLRRDNGSGLLTSGNRYYFPCISLHFPATNSILTLFPREQLSCYPWFLWVYNALKKEFETRNWRPRLFLRQMFITDIHRCIYISIE